MNVEDHSTKIGGATRVLFDMTDMLLEKISSPSIEVEKKIQIVTRPGDLRHLYPVSY